MQKSTSQKVIGFIIRITLFAACVWFISSQTGMEPLWVAICITLAKGLVRFVYRLTVMLVSTASVVALLVLLLTCI
jgi:hypothetical protein